MCQVSPFTYPIKGERLERLKARDANGSPAYPAEWAQLIRQESPSLRLYLKTLLWRQRDVESDADDALQVTWLLILRKAGPDYGSDVLERAYLFAQARAAASDVIRKGQREKALGSTGDDSAIDDDFESSILALLASRGESDEQALRQALDDLLALSQPKLTDLEYRIVVYHLIDGLTFAVIAVDSDQPKGTAATTYYRALEKVRKGLSDRAEPPLTEFERQVMDMRHADKKKFTKIAQELNLPLSTVQAEYREAVAKVWQGLWGGGFAP
ncbi:MAG: RNA polymerase sigma factor [Pirellulales bacterium]